MTDVVEAPSERDGEPVTPGGRRRGRWWPRTPWPDQPRWVSAAVWVGVVAPFAATFVWALGQPFLPGRDRGLMELQVMDVFTADTPLVGVWSRIGWHHPGPWPLWLLAVPYRLFGSSHSLLLAAVVVNLAAAVLLVAVLRRAMPSWMGLLSCVAVLAVLHSFGGAGLADPWNPWIAVLPALVALVAGALAFERFWFGLVAIAGAGFAAQAHVGFVPVMGTLTVIALVWLVTPLVRRADRPTRVPWRIASVVAVVVVVWAPVVLEEVVHDPGNLTLLVEDATDPPARADIDGQPMRRVTLGEAVDLAAHEVSPDSSFVTHAPPTGDYDDVGAVSRWWLLLPAACIALGAALWRWGTLPARRYLVTTWLLTGVTAIGFSRLFGIVFPYQLMSGTVVVFGLLTSTAWMAGCAVLTTDGRRLVVRVASVAAIAVLAVACTLDLRGAEIPEQRQSDISEAIVPPAVERLRDAGIDEVSIDPAQIPWLDWAMTIGLRRAGISVREGTDVACVLAVRAAGDPVPEGWSTWATWTVPPDDAVSGPPIRQFLESRGSTSVLAGPGCG